jgi:hypothetical protein
MTHAVMFFAVVCFVVVYVWLWALVAIGMRGENAARAAMWKEFCEHFGIDNG